MYVIDEMKTERDMFILKVREYIRNRGYATYYDIAREFYGYTDPFNEKLEIKYGMSQKKFKECVETNHIIRVQYSEKAHDMWYYDPNRERHLIEEISGIGPE